jgi:hypothetical protein
MTLISRIVSRGCKVELLSTATTKCANHLSGLMLETVRCGF